MSGLVALVSLVQSITSLAWSPLCPTWSLVCPAGKEPLISYYCLVSGMVILMSSQVIWVSSQGQASCPARSLLVSRPMSVLVTREPGPVPRESRMVIPVSNPLARMSSRARTTIFILLSCVGHVVSRPMETRAGLASTLIQKETHDRMTTSRLGM